MRKPWKTCIRSIRWWWIRPHPDHRGKPAVTDILPGGLPEAELLKLAAALEEKSEHPFAKAILEKAAGVDHPRAEKFETIPGKGVSGVIEGKKFFGGNGRLMEELGVQIPALPDSVDAGGTPLHFASENGIYLGTIVAADVLKADSVAAVAAMKKMHLNVVMLTGDNEKTAPGHCCQGRHRPGHFRRAARR